MATVVKRLTVSFPEELWEKVERYAKEKRRSVPSVIVGACEQFLQEEERKEAIIEAQTNPDYTELKTRLDRVEGKLH